MRCRHERNSWILGGVWEWCYRCGALRRLRPIGVNASAADSGWQRPQEQNPSELPPRRMTTRDRDDHAVGCALRDVYRLRVVTANGADYVRRGLHPCMPIEFASRQEAIVHLDALAAQCRDANLAVEVVRVPMRGPE